MLFSKIVLGIGLIFGLCIVIIQSGKNGPQEKKEKFNCQNIFQCGKNGPQEKKEKFNCQNIYRCIPNKKSKNPDQSTTSNQSQNDVPQIRYKSVLISFRQIMEEKSKAILASQDISRTQRMKYKWSQTFTKPSEENIYKRKNIEDLNSDALNLVKSYQLVFKKANDYTARASCYRLLLWLKINMEQEQQQTDKLEKIINDIFPYQKVGNRKTPTDLVQIIIREKEIKEQSNSISTMDDLRTSGDKEAQITEICLLLASKDGKFVEDENHTMPTKDDVQPYEELLSEIGSKNKDFQSIVGQLYIYDVAYTKNHHFTYERVQDESRELNTSITTDTSILDLKYYRDIMILYNHAIEKTLLFSSVNQDTMDKILQLENFPIYHQNFKEIRGDAFEWLAYKVVLDYDIRVYRLKVNSGDWNKESVECYDRLLEWLFYYHTKRILEYQNPNQSVAQLVKNLREFKRAGGWRNDIELDDKTADAHPERKFTLKEEEYLKINTVDLLVGFCKTGLVKRYSALRILDNEVYTTAPSSPTT